MNDTDTERIASSLLQAGDLLDAHGGTVLKLVDEWIAGPRSANLEPAQSARYELVWMPDDDGVMVQVSVQIPGFDITGEAVLIDAPETKAELNAILGRLSKDSIRLRNLIAAIVPVVARDLAEPADWCSNHLRAGMCEPRHRGDLCRRCYDFKLAEGILPPGMILGMWSRGDRVSADHVKRALATEQRRNEFTTEVSTAIRKARPARKVTSPPPHPVQQQPVESREDMLTRKREEALARVREAG